MRGSKKDGFRQSPEGRRCDIVVDHRTLIGLKGTFPLENALKYFMGAGWDGLVMLCMGFLMDHSRLCNGLWAL